MKQPPNETYAPPAIMAELRDLEALAGGASEPPVGGQSPAPETPPRAASDDLGTLTVPTETPAPASETTAPTRIKLPDHTGTPPTAPANPALTSQMQAFEERLAKSEQAYRTLQGKYDAETERNSDEIRRLRDENEQLKRAQAAKPQTWDDDTYAKLGISSDLIEDYPLEMREMVRQIAEAAIPAALDAMLPQAVQRHIDAQLGPTRERLEQSAMSAYEKAVTDKFPNWATVQQDPAFAQWLRGTVDDVTGLPYAELLGDAIAMQDAQRTAAIFQRFASASPRTSLAAQTMPGTRGNGSAAPPARAGSGNGNRIWTHAEAETLMDDIIRGAYTKERAKELTTELDLAFAEGRVEGEPGFRGRR